MSESKNSTTETNSTELIPNLTPASHKKIWLSLIIAVVVIVLTSVVYGFAHHHKSNETVIARNPVKCSMTELKTAAQAILSNSLSQMQPVANEIKGTNAYQEDANCLYVLTNYYLLSGNVSDATTTFQHFQQVYVATVGLNSILSTNSQNSVASLRTTIDNLPAAGSQNDSVRGIE